MKSKYTFLKNIYYNSQQQLSMMDLHFEIEIFAEFLATGLWISIKKSINTVLSKPHI